MISGFRIASHSFCRDGPVARLRTQCHLRYQATHDEKRAGFDGACTPEDGAAPRLYDDASGSYWYPNPPSARHRNRRCHDRYPSVAIFSFSTSTSRSNPNPGRVGASR